MAQVAIMPSPLPFADPLLLSDSLGLLHPLSFVNGGAISGHAAE